MDQLEHVHFGRLQAARTLKDQVVSLLDDVAQGYVFKGDIGHLSGVRHANIKGTNCEESKRPVCWSTIKAAYLSISMLVN